MCGDDGFAIGQWEIELPNQIHHFIERFFETDIDNDPFVTINKPDKYCNRVADQLDG